MAPPSSLASLDGLSVDELQFFFHHVFLPPKLPHAAEESSPDLEAALLDALHKSLKAFSAHCPEIQFALNMAFEGLDRIFATLTTDGTLSEAATASELTQICDAGKGLLPLYIRAQNAGLILAATNENLVIESFELSAHNQAVLAPKGRLGRTFPSAGVAVDSTTAKQAQFQEALAHTLAKMSSRPVHGMQPKSQKAGSLHDEDRDTTHPGAVTELVLGGFLRGHGYCQVNEAISKHTRDEVLWTDGVEIPWRRSPFWLFIRVFTQLTFTRRLQNGGRNWYKAFMVFFMARIMETTRRASPNGERLEMLFSMSSKVSRRLHKLPSGVPTSLRSAICDSLAKCGSHLSEAWSAIQNPASYQLNLDILPYLDFASDSKVFIPELDECLNRLNVTTSSARQLAPELSSGVTRLWFDEMPGPLALSADSPYDVANLEQFEKWASTGLAAVDLPVEEFCTRVKDLLVEYVAVARTVYIGNAEALSMMVLTALELWVACDRRAIKHCPLLSKYDPGIPTAPLENLILPFNDQTARLRKLEGYIAQRKRNASFGSNNLFGTPGDRGNKGHFAVQYFDSSQENAKWRGFLNARLAKAESERREKITELESMTEQYIRLKRDCEEMTCDMSPEPSKTQNGVPRVEWVHDEQKCEKCGISRKMNSLSIAVHEWPLPSQDEKAKAIVFELHLPRWYASWRGASVFLLLDVLKAQYSARKAIKAEWSLRDDYHLGKWHGKHQRRIGLWSETKAQKKTHFKRKWLNKEPTVEDVCVENGMSYRYADEDNECFMADLSFTQSVAQDCTYRLPSHAESLKSFIFRPADLPDGASPNSVVASQPNCPEQLKVSEFAELSSLPLGHRIQWMNLLVQLWSPGIDFKKPETVIVILQCLGQVGPPESETGNHAKRPAHAIAAIEDFGQRILTALEALLRKHEENWESANALVAFSAIASRLRALSSSKVVREACISYINRLIDISFRWVQKLRAKSQDAAAFADRTESRTRTMEVALICANCFSVEDDALAVLLADSARSSTLFQCATLIAERVLHKAKVPGSLTALIYTRFKRILRRQYSSADPNAVGLDDAVRMNWQDYRPSEHGWRSEPGSRSHWLVTESMLPHGDEMRVHYDMLSGQLLVNGSRVQRPPEHYQQHPLYKILFSTADVEVMPSSVPGMQFSTTKAWAGFSVNLGWKGESHLLVQARRDNELYQIVPGDILEGRYPSSFKTEYIHWHNFSKGTVELRPVDKPWDISAQVWTLSPVGQSNWCLGRGDRSVLGLQSTTALRLSAILSPLVESFNMHILLDRKGCLEIDIPGISTGFFLDPRSSKILSREFRGMIIDRDQWLGTMIGLKNKLLLKGRESRRVLILEGSVCYKRHFHHVEVTIDRGNATKIHDLEVDNKLGVLKDRGDLQCKLRVAYIHALTSFCLSDPVTRKTGTEQALTILRSAAARSFEQLSSRNMDLLLDIARLTPSRSYYPSKEIKPMQVVQWDSELSFLSQHGGLYLAVQAILEQASRSSIFYPGAKKVPMLKHADAHLLERDLIRSSSFRVDGFGAEDHTVMFDQEYLSRDQGQGSIRSTNAFIISRTIYAKKQTLHWAAPARGSLWQLAQNTTSVSGPLRNFERETMRFDSSLLHGSAEGLLRDLPMLQTALRSEHEQVNPFNLAIWLSSMAFGEEPCFGMIQAVALFFTAKCMQEIQGPDVDTFTPADGHTANSSLKPTFVENIIENAAVDFDKSPDAFTKAKEGVSERMAQESRARRYELNVKKAARGVVDSLWKFWEKTDPGQPKIGKDLVPYLDVQRATEIVAAKFKTIRDNKALREYLCKMEIALSELETEELMPPLWTVPKPIATAQHGRGYFSVDYLFSGEAPTLATWLPSLPSDDVRLEKPSTQANTYGDRLANLMKRLEGLESSYEQAYVKDLQASIESLEKQKDSRRSDLAEEVLASFRAEAEEHWMKATQQLQDAVTKTCISRLLGTKDVDTATIQEHKSTVQHLPRWSPVFILGQLNRTRWSKLSPEWQACVIHYALALTTFQRAERLLRALNSADKDGLIRELDNPGHTNWNPAQYPETLLLEAESNILVREVQEQIAFQMRSPHHARNSMMQLNMGEGKSSVILPIVTTALADTSQMVRVICAKPQSKQMWQMLVSKLGGLLNRRVFFMPFSRAIKLEKYKTEAVKKLCQECMAEGGVMLLQPEHILSFKLMGPELFIDNKIEVGKEVLQIQNWLDQHSRDIVDESDENFDVKFELIYTMGVQQPIELMPLRWMFIHQILDLVRLAASGMAPCPGLEYEGRSLGSFPRIRFLGRDTEDELIRRVARHISDHGLRGFPIAHYTAEMRNAMFVYITKYELTDVETKAVEKGPFFSVHYKASLLLLRGLLATGILTFAFGQKRWRVNYGLTDRAPPTRLAVPYRAKDCPTLRSEFSHPDVVIVLTSLSYYYGGLEDDSLYLAMQHLKKAGAEDEYRSWVKDSSMPETFRHLVSVNLNDKATCETVVFPHLRHAKGAIDYFLAQVVFPKEMREFPNKMSASGWDLGKAKSLPTTGFSGTNDSKDLLPLDVAHLDLPKQRHTNALVLGHLLQDDNAVALMPPKDASDAVTDAERLLRMVMGLPDSPEVILDVGAQILELDNLSVASAWLSKHQKKKAVIFCNENDELTVVDRRGHCEALQTSSFAARTDECLVYLDEAHTRGIDIKLPPYYRAAVTLSANVTKDRICQASMRMRQLGKGQSVVFCVPNEIRTKILNCTKKGEGSQIEVVDVLHWAIHETFSQVRRSVPLWVTQGHRFVLQEDLWSNVYNGGKAQNLFTKELAMKFLEPEARSIEFRYRPGRAFEDRLKKLEESIKTESRQRSTQERFGQIIRHFKRFGQAERSARRLQEEQERELSPEVEEEAVVEGAQSATPAEHKLHQDLKLLVRSGKIVAGESAAYGRAFAKVLDGTSAVKGFKIGTLDDKNGDRFLATTDFSRTVQEQAGSGQTSDAFQRHVQWVLTIRKDSREKLADYVVLVSPYEARLLFDQVQCSNIAALHLYKPRCSLAAPALDHLDLYSIPSSRSKVTIPRQVSVALNVFAGQLYFSSFEEYRETCRYLGLASSRAEKGWKVTNDGFILNDGTASKDKMPDQNPVEFLKVLLMKVRRNIEEFDRSHMGRMLEGELLTLADFEE